MMPTATPPFVHVYTKPVEADAAVRATVKVAVEGVIAVALTGCVRMTTLLRKTTPPGVWAAARTPTPGTRATDVVNPRPATDVGVAVPASLNTRNRLLNASATTVPSPVPV